jgi:hypothetical protein
MDIGKPVFFLYPETEQHRSLITFMVRNEFEVYTIENTYRFVPYLKQCEQCILIIDPHFGLTLKKWGDFIAESLLPLIEGESSIIFFTVKELFSILKEPFPEKWIHGSGEKTGEQKIFFIDQEQEPGIISDHLQNILENRQARGQRRYVRFGSVGEADASFQFTIDGRTFSGTVHDISSVGMSCAFEKEMALKVNERISDMELRLGDRTFNLKGEVFQQRKLDERKRLFVVMFDRNMSETVRHTLQDFIHSSLQMELDWKLNQQR